MVTSVTNLSRSGLYDWMAQRVSAVLLAAYTLFLVALAVHAWVGMWTISTDYLTPMAMGKAATIVRFLFQVACGLLMFVLFVWGVQILWGF